MNKCQFVEVKNNEYYCLGTKEIDPCPSEGNPYSSCCYYPCEKKDKEIHFYSSMDYAFSAMGPQLYKGWEGTLEALQEGVPIIHTLQMGILIYSSEIFDAGYRIFIWDDHGEFELTLGNCARTNRKICYAHNHFNMWVNGEFTNYEKETNEPSIIRKETL